MLICEAAQSHLHVCVCELICLYFVEQLFKGAAVGEQRFTQIGRLIKLEFHQPVSLSRSHWIVLIGIRVNFFLAVVGFQSASCDFI